MLHLSTQRVGAAFGPIVLLWFAVLAATGAWQIAQEPSVLQALDPRRAAAFLVERGPALFLAVGAIVLAITGAEALYADLGHFGRRPIQIASGSAFGHREGGRPTPPSCGFGCARRASRGKKGACPAKRPAAAFSRASSIGSCSPSTRWC